MYSQSTVNLFDNPHLLTNIRCADHYMRIRYNSSIMTVTQVVYLKLFDMVWNHMNDIANIIFLAKAKDKFQVTCSSDKGNRFELHKPDDTTRYFNQTPIVLH